MPQRSLGSAAFEGALAPAASAIVAASAINARRDVFIFHSLCLVGSRQLVHLALLQSEQRSGVTKRNEPAQKDSDQEHHAADDIVPERIHRRGNECVMDNGQEYDPEDRPSDGSAAAVDVGAADRDRSNCFELSEIPVRPMGRAIFGGSHDSGASGERRRKHVNDDLDPADVDAGQTRSPFAAANEIELAKEPLMAEQNAEDERGDGEEKDGNVDPQNLALSEEEKRVRKSGNGMTVGDREVDSPQGEKSPHRDDQRMHAEQDREDAIQRPDGGGRKKRDENGRNDGEAGLHHEFGDQDLREGED